MLHVIVLGAAAGGGIPQWNCGCRICVTARTERADLRGTQTSVAVSADDKNWFLINASPDLRQQLIATPGLHPRAGHLRNTAIAGIILTNGEVDAVAGLLSMREGSRFTLYAHPRVLSILKDNSIFNVLSAANVRREAMTPDEPFELQSVDGAASGLEVLPFGVPGKAALYMDEKAPSADGGNPGDTLGLRISDTGTGRYLYVIPACARLTPDLTSRLAGAPLVLFDGTVWRDDELIAAGLGNKTGRSMGHIAMSGDDGAIAGLADLGIARKIFIHVNNSNPAWLPESVERRTLVQAGWDVACDGMDITL